MGNSFFMPTTENSPTLQAKAQNCTGWNISISLNMSWVTERHDVMVWRWDKEQITYVESGSGAVKPVLKSELLLLEAEKAQLKLI